MHMIDLRRCLTLLGVSALVACNSKQAPESPSAEGGKPAAATAAPAADQPAEPGVKPESPGASAPSKGADVPAAEGKPAGDQPTAGQPTADKAPDKPGWPEDPDSGKVFYEGPAELRGEITDTGVSRGKTLAAWNGIPVDRGWARLKQQGGQSVLVQLPEGASTGNLKGRKFKIKGTWRPAAPDPVYKPGEPIPQMPIQQMPVQQMPIELEGRPGADGKGEKAPGGWQPVPHEPVLVAEEMAPM